MRGWMLGIVISLLEEFLPKAYKTSDSKWTSARSKIESMQMHRRMVDALVKAFPGASDRA